jgi:hypothetical protein
MDEKKKTEREEREQLGPYQFEEQMPQEDLSAGELYRATYEKSGATALVFKPAAGMGHPWRAGGHRGCWGLSFRGDSSPRGPCPLDVPKSRKIQAQQPLGIARL